MNSIQKSNDQLQKLKHKLQTFCLNPNVADYNKISSSVKLQNQLGANYTIWSAAVNYKYNFVASDKSAFVTEFNKINTQLLTKPSKAVLDKICHIFFAIGDIENLRQIFETAGNSAAPKQLQNMAIELYEDTRNMYAAKISNLLCLDSKFVEKHLFSDIVAENFQIFTKFEEIINSKSAESGPLPDDIKDLIDKIAESTPKQPDITPEEREKQEKIKSASDIFDEIAFKTLKSIDLKKPKLNKKK